MGVSEARKYLRTARPPLPEIVRPWHGEYIVVSRVRERGGHVPAPCAGGRPMIQRYFEEYELYADHYEGLYQ